MFVAVDQLVRYPTGIAENMRLFHPHGFHGARHGSGQEDSSHPWKIIPQHHQCTQLRGSREIQFNINENKEKFAFRPRVERCSIIKVTQPSRFPSLDRLIHSK